jgi:hypothetical protein
MRKHDLQEGDLSIGETAGKDAYDKPTLVKHSNLKEITRDFDFPISVPPPPGP